MYYKVLGTTSQVNEDTLAIDLGRVDSDAERRIVEAGARGRIELPAVPGTPQDQLPSEVVAARPPCDALLDGPETERTPMMRAAVAHAAKLPTHRYDADLTSFDPGDDVAVSLEIGERAHVVPAAHGFTGPGAWGEGGGYPGGPPTA
jgi:cell pole-organizing protein PopZ